MNREVRNYLQKFDVEDANYIVNLLIDGGFIEDGLEPLTDPEKYAQAARDWVGGDVQNAFHFASGWTTDSWEHVLNAQLDGHISLDHNISAHKDIFRALVILAKEAGEDL